MFLYLGRSIFMTRLKLHYAMQKWYPADFMSINLGINLLRVQDATYTQWCTILNQNGAKKYGKFLGSLKTDLSTTVYLVNYLKLFAILIG